MPLKPELTDFIGRAVTTLDETVGQVLQARLTLQQLAAIGNVVSAENSAALSGAVTDVVAKARQVVQAALDAFEATDFKTADVNPVEPAPTEPP